MANVNPPARANNVHSPTGVSIAAAELTAFTAGSTIVFQNNGNTIVHLHVTTAGTGTVDALNSANNVALTLSTGDLLLGPYDQAVFGNQVTITTATAVGTVGLYSMATRYANGLRSPFETNAAASDAP